MKKFTKGTLVSIVEDDDRRIADYHKNGWKEVVITMLAPTDAADKTLAKVMKDVSDGDQSKGKKVTAADKKVNAAIKANTEAAAESEAVDDGLTAKEGK